MARRKWQNEHIFIPVARVLFAFIENDFNFQLIMDCASVSKTFLHVPRFLSDQMSISFSYFFAVCYFASSATFFFLLLLIFIANEIFACLQDMTLLFNLNENLWMCLGENIHCFFVTSLYSVLLSSKEFLLVWHILCFSRSE